MKMVLVTETVLNFDDKLLSSLLYSSSASDLLMLFATLVPINMESNLICPVIRTGNLQRAELR